MLLGTHRVAPTSNDQCTRIYLRKKRKRSTEPSAKELRIRSRFTEVGNAVRLRAKDLMQINADQAAFLAQRDLPDGKKTMKAYLWKVCGDAYDEQHGA